jgi:putative Mg2+ transporter-C (MgtC) family protein
MLNLNWLSILNDLDQTIVFQLFLAALAGAFLGWERERVGKPAGIRTFSLVSIGSTLYIVLSNQLLVQYVGSNFDPTRVIGQIIVGIGFLGAGTIMHFGHEVIGLTTAAELWVVAGIGAAIGLGFYGVALFVTVLSFLIIFTARRWTKKSDRAAHD